MKTKSFKRYLRDLTRDQRFRATVSAMNTLLIAKGVYTQREFEHAFCQWAAGEEKKRMKEMIADYD